MQKRNNNNVVTEILNLSGQHVLDVGCGDGTIPAFKAKETDIRVAFESLGKMEDGLHAFTQPMRVNLLRKG